MTGKRQLTEVLAASSAAPARVRVTIERLRETGGSVVEAAFAEEMRADAIVRVLSASTALSRMIVAEPELLEALDALGSLDAPQPGQTTDPGSPGIATATELDRFARRELLATAARDLVGLDDLVAVTARLSQRAELALRAAASIASVDEGLAVIAMGKLGAKELNYASDVDLVFVADADRPERHAAARRLLELARRSFRVDVDLRPEGRNGPLLSSLAAYDAYWEHWARPWEFQALMKARYVAGDAALGASFEAHARQALWARRLGPEELAELRRMKARSEQLAETPGRGGEEIKRGRGGIRDIEFAIQLLQLVHGPFDSEIRLSSTLEALAELARAGYVDPRDASSLSIGYAFLRTVEHRLQLLELGQVHRVPSELARRDELARVLGFTATNDETAAGRFDRCLHRYQSVTRSIHERLFFRPLLEAFKAIGSEPTERRELREPPEPPELPGRLAPPSAKSDAALDLRLSALGFTEASRTHAALAELTRGLTRSSRLMRQLLPALLEWCSEAPDPDLALLGLRNLVGTGHRQDVVIASFRDSPEVARRTCELLGTSRRLGELLAHSPSLLATLDDDVGLRPRPTEALVELARAAVADQGPDARLALRHLVWTETTRVAAFDILGLGRVPDATRQDRPGAHAASPGDLRPGTAPRTEWGPGSGLAAIAAAVLEVVLELLEPHPVISVIALGRLGGAELAYGSDLDLLIVHEGRSDTDRSAALRCATELLSICNGPTPAERLCTVDTALRPEGRSGPVSRSLDAYAEYYGRWGATWERQALLRARPVAGDVELGEAFMAVARTASTGAPFGPTQWRELRQIKARIERERIPAGEDPAFHLKLGPGSLSDIEWAVQCAQLEAGVHEPSTLSALARLGSAGVLDPDDAAILTDAYRFCEAVRNRWHLVGNFLAGSATTSGRDSLPLQPKQIGPLARSLDTTPVELRNDYRRVTRRARHVVERRFYGIEG